MSIIKTRTVKNYNDDMQPRQRVIRFLQDNKDSFLDYPVNKVFLVDREDLIIYDHLTGPFETKCTSAGLICSIALTLGFVLKNKGPSILIAPVMFFPVPISYFYCYYKLGEFLDYCQIKYKDRGLNDEDLWNYHKENSKIV